MTQTLQEPGPHDGELLRDYFGGTSPQAFAELVRRHVDLVYSSARSVLADRQLAEDVTQNTFLLLAQKAPTLTDRRDLAGWLYQTAKLDARTVLRKRSRQERRIAELALQTTQQKDSMQSQQWNEIDAHLGDALELLGENEREAVLMRYFQRRPYERIAAALGVTEAAARQRVHRALEHLRQLLGEKGVVASATTLGAAMKAHAVHPAPAGLAARAIEAASRIPMPPMSAKAAASTLGPIKSKALAAVILGATGLAGVGIAVVASLHRRGSESLYVDGDSTRTPGAPVRASRPPGAADVRSPFRMIQAVSFDDHRGTRAVAGFIGYISPGDWLRFNRVDLGPANQQPATINAVVDCPDQYAGNSIDVHADRLDGPLLARLEVKSTGGYGKWRLCSAPLSGASGVHDLFLRFSGGGWNLDTIKVTLPHRPVAEPIRAVSYNEGHLVQTRGDIVCETTEGTWARYSGLDFGSELKKAVALTYACGNTQSDGRIEIRLDRPDGPRLGELQVENTGGWGSFQTRIIPISGVAGTHDVVLIFSGQGHGIADLHTFQFLDHVPAPQTRPATGPATRAVEPWLEAGLPAGAN